VENITKRAKYFFLDKIQEKPFIIDSDRLTMLQPAERLEILRLNKNKEFLKDKRKNKNKLFFLITLPNLFNLNIKKIADERFLELVKQWLNIFMIHYETGYFDSSELLYILQAMKSALVPVNQVNQTSFAIWVFKFVRRFLKISLFRLVDKIYSEMLGMKKSTLKYFAKIFENGGALEKGLNFGSLRLTRPHDQRPEADREVQVQVPRRGDQPAAGAVLQQRLRYDSLTRLLPAEDPVPDRLGRPRPRPQSAGVLLQPQRQSYRQRALRLQSAPHQRHP
jgi:hypothetical protein